MPICTQGIKRTWWPEAGTIIVTGPYYYSEEDFIEDNLWSPPPWQNGIPFADDIFKYIFVIENVRISIRISLKFVRKSPIDNKSALVQVMAWCWTGNKPLPESMLTQFSDAYMMH